MARRQVCRGLAAPVYSTQADGAAAAAAAAGAGDNGLTTSMTQTATAAATADEILAARGANANAASWGADAAAAWIQNANDRLGRCHATIGVFRGALDAIVFGCGKKMYVRSGH